MSRRSVRLPTDGRPILDLLSLGRPGPSGRFSPAQIEQIRRTVSRTPEVMVKVTGGGTKTGAVAAHLAYISRNGKLAIETDEGDRVADQDAQKALLRDWHLDLSAGLYRAPRDGRATARAVKLVHNIVLSMPSPTPADKVLAAARKFAREKFALQHRYAMVLHTDQQHPHVHMVVKAESEEGRRLHIDKAMLREWREDFARLMREQGIAANATPRVIRGRNKGKTRDAIYRARQRGASNVVRERVTDIAKQLMLTGSFHDPARPKLLETRKSVFNGWLEIADGLDVQGEVALAGDVRHFARHLPRVMTDRELVARGLTNHLDERAHKGPVSEVTRMRREEFSR
jgi:Relaxase/Mobilisation nuclease domain